MSLQLPACYLLGMVQHILDQSGARPRVHRDSEAVATATGTDICALGTNRNAVHQYRPIVDSTHCHFLIPKRHSETSSLGLH